LELCFYISILSKQKEKDPQNTNELQAHWARAKRQQHLPKELVLHLKVQQYQSFICGKTRYVTLLTPKLCGAGAANTAQKSNAGDI
jgi:hypothetical protein